MIKKGKKKITELAIICTMLVVMALPVFAASSSWGFSMGVDGRVIDGSSNGVYHKLSAGKVNISGKVKTVSSKALTSGTNDVYIALYNKTSGNFFGTVSVTPSAYINGEVSFSNTFATAVGGGTNYYLVIYRLETDGKALKGYDGVLANK